MAWRSAAVLSLTSIVSWSAMAAEPDVPVIKGAVRHPFVCSDSGSRKVLRFSAEGKLEWECPAGSTYDVWALPSGNLLFDLNDGVVEVTPEKKIVLQYKAEGEVFCCQRLPDGNTLVGECSKGRLVEVSPEGKVVKSIPVTSRNGKFGHGTMRMARKLANGHYLVSHLGERCAREYDADGKVVREIKGRGPVFAAVRLPNGNTVVCDLHSVFEIDPADKIVWEVTKKEILPQILRKPGPEMAKGEGLMTGIQRLPNGNTVICNWFGHGREPNSAPIFEVTPAKKVVWQFTDTVATRHVSNVQLLDVKGDATQGEILR